LEDKSAVALTQALSGLGGLGKTQTVVVEYAYRHRDNYEALYWALADKEARGNEEAMTITRERSWIDIRVQM